MYHRCNDHGIDFEGCYGIVCSYLNISYIRYAVMIRRCTVLLYDVLYDVSYCIITRQSMIRSSEVKSSELKCSVVDPEQPRIEN